MNKKCYYGLADAIMSYCEKNNIPKEEIPRMMMEIMISGFIRNNVKKRYLKSLFKEIMKKCKECEKSAASTTLA